MLSAFDFLHFIQKAESVSDEEMHWTFDVATGFVISVSETDADALAAAVEGRVIGRVEDGAAVEIRGLSV
ncbi:hypothetical protein [Natrinema gelatinilyticum]|uniref:hypothetical protein n=1 Tax=Natrinema gelatinilyticum TaxID=2961571 RepID=UPI0030F3A387